MERTLEARRNTNVQTLVILELLIHTAQNISQKWFASNQAAKVVRREWNTPQLWLKRLESNTRKPQGKLHVWRVIILFRIAKLISLCLWVIHVAYFSIRNYDILAGKLLWVCVGNNQGCIYLTVSCRRLAAAFTDVLKNLHDDYMDWYEWW